MAITVRDTGVGIDPAQSNHYSRRTSRAIVAAPEGDGLGLGLTLVKRLVELHGGTVTARSEGRGRGSEFELTLPLARATPARTNVTEVDATVPRRRILVIDDEPDVADTFVALLDELDQDVKVAYGGEAAIRLAREHRPQAAFVDLTMPDMSGVEVARRLRELLRTDELTLVALTGHGKGSVPDGDDFDHYLLKPADLAEVAKLLSSLPGDAEQETGGPLVVIGECDVHSP